MNVGSYVRSGYDRMLGWRGVIVGKGPCPNLSCALTECCAIVEWTTPTGETATMSHILPGALTPISPLRALAEQA